MNKETFKESCKEIEREADNELIEVYIDIASNMHMEDKATTWIANCELEQVQKGMAIMQDVIQKRIAKMNELI